MRTLLLIIVNSAVMAISTVATTGEASKSIAEIQNAEAYEAVDTNLTENGQEFETEEPEESTEKPEETAEDRTENSTKKNVAESDGTYSAKDKKLLKKIAMAEAEGESVEGKALVMLVVLNRVQSEDFPDTIEDVVFQKNQFSPVREGGRFYTTDPDNNCRKALKLVLSGWDESEGALYFESCKNSSWHSRNLEFLYEVGNHRFYK